MTEKDFLETTSLDLRISPPEDSHQAELPDYAPVELQAFIQRASHLNDAPTPTGDEGQVR